RSSRSRRPPAAPGPEREDRSGCFFVCSSSRIVLSFEGSDIVDQALLKGYGDPSFLPGSSLLHSAIDAAQRHLISRQSDEGYWKSELNGDATLESDAVMLMHYLGDVD